LFGSLTELFDIVNLRDEVVGREVRAKVHDLGLLHRAVHIFVRTEVGHWVLQKRSSCKDIDPHMWTTSCSGHLDSGEDYLEAAIRECKEELNLQIGPEQLIELLRISPCTETGNEFVRVYALNQLVKPKMNKMEIAELKALDLKTIDCLVNSNPEKCSLSFLHIFPMVVSKLKTLT
jgi:isopentenyldiphosphate isomerase